MKVTSNRKLAKVLASEKKVRKHFGEMADAVMDVLAKIKAVKAFKDLWKLPGNFHPIKYAVANVFSITLKHPFRMVMSFDKLTDTLTILAIEDYHDKCRLVEAYN